MKLAGVIMHGVIVFVLAAGLIGLCRSSDATVVSDVGCLSWGIAFGTYGTLIVLSRLRRR